MWRLFDRSRNALRCGLNNCHFHSGSAIAFANLIDFSWCDRLSLCDYAQERNIIHRRTVNAQAVSPCIILRLLRFTSRYTTAGVAPTSRPPCTRRIRCTFADRCYRFARFIPFQGIRRRGRSLSWSSQIRTTDRVFIAVVLCDCAGNETRKECFRNHLVVAIARRMLAKYRTTGLRFPLRRGDNLTFFNDSAIDFQ